MSLIQLRRFRLISMLRGTSLRWRFKVIALAMKMARKSPLKTRFLYERKLHVLFS